MDFWGEHDWDLENWGGEGRVVTLVKPSRFWSIQALPRLAIFTLTFILKRSEITGNIRKARLKLSLHGFVFGKGKKPHVHCCSFPRTTGWDTTINFFYASKLYPQRIATKAVLILPTACPRFSPHLWIHRQTIMLVPWGRSALYRKQGVLVKTFHWASTM